MARYIFITGGVVSSLGKGLASAALGALLQARGYKARLRKLDQGEYDALVVASGVETTLARQAARARCALGPLARAGVLVPAHPGRSQLPLRGL